MNKKPIKKRADLIKYYQNEKLVEEYEGKRFSKPEDNLLHENQVRFVNQQIEKLRFKKILEIAPGPARITKHINLEGYLLDSSPKMLIKAKKELIKKNKKWKIIQGNAFNIKINVRFDLIYTFRFLRHFEIKDRKELYAQINKQLNKEGFLIFDAPDKFTENIFRKGKKKFYPVYDELWTKKKLKKELEQNGFKVIKIKENLKLYFLYVAISKITIYLKISQIGFRIIKTIETLIPNKIINKPKEWLLLCQKK